MRTFHQEQAVSKGQLKKKLILLLMLKRKLKFPTDTATALLTAKPSRPLPIVKSIKAWLFLRAVIEKAIQASFNIVMKISTKALELI